MQLCNVKMLSRDMKNCKRLVLFVMVLMLLSGLNLIAFADDAHVVVEDIVDAVAEEEAAAAAEAARAAEDAERLNDMIDLDFKGEDSVPEPVSTMESVTLDESGSSIASGPILALITAAVLIVGGMFIIAASNRKIRAGRKAR